MKPCAADDNLPLPSGRTVVIDGAEHKCFTADEYRQVVYALVDYRAALEAAETAAEMIASVQRERDYWKQIAGVEKKRGDDFKLELKKQLTPWWVAVVTEAAAILVLGGAEIARAAK